MEIRVSSMGNYGDGCADHSWQQPGVRVSVHSMGCRFTSPKRGTIRSLCGKLVWVQMDTIHGGEIVPLYPGQLQPVPA